jgi:hypothetical protein
MLVKDFSLDGKILEARVEFFNLLNRPNFEAPNLRARTVFTNSAGAVNGSVGRLTRTVTSSRQVQVGLKFLF